MHNPLTLIFAYWLFSAVIGGMPEPVPTSACAYRWCFSSLHLLAGNVGTAMSARYPTMVLPAPK